MLFLVSFSLRASNAFQYISLVITDWKKSLFLLSQYVKVNTRSYYIESGN